MAQASSFLPQYHQGNTAIQQPGNSNAYVVVDQQPSRRETFPYSLNVKGIFVLSILKLIIGSLLFITGIVNVAVLQYDTKIAFGIWCGLTILSNGIIGCIIKFKQKNCLIASFLALSITSLIFDIAMLSFYSIVLEYFVNVQRYYCYYVHYIYHCETYLSSDAKDVGVGLTSFLLLMVVCELVCSIRAVVLSGKAYSKCCNTCDVKDCGTCIGCCECDTTPLYGQQARQPFVPLYNNDQNIHVSSVPPHTYQYNPNQAQVNPPVQIPASYNVQGTQNNPCSGVMSFFASMPAYLFGGTTGTQLSAINVSVQAIPVNQQHLVTDPDRNASQAPVTSTVGTGQRPTFNTWEKLDG